MAKHVGSVVERVHIGRVAPVAAQAPARQGIAAGNRLVLDLDLFRFNVKRIAIVDAEQFFCFFIHDEGEFVLGAGQAN